MSMSEPFLTFFTLLGNARLPYDMLAFLFLVYIFGRLMRPYML